MIGELSALATAFCWSGSSISFAEASLLIGSVRVNVTRLILAGLLLGVTLVLFDVPVDLSFSQFAYLFLSGVFGLVFGDSFLFKSYEYNGPRISALVMSSAPAFAAVLAYFILGEYLSMWAIGGMFITLIGIGLVVLSRQEPTGRFRGITAQGILFAFLGACGQAGGLITAKLAFDQGSINGFAATSIRIVSALLFLIPISIASRRFLAPWKLYAARKKAFGLTLLGAVLGPYFGITLSLIAIQHTEVAIAATIMATVPIIMLPLVKIVYHEVLSWRAYAGAFIAVAGVAILFLI